MQLTTNTQTSEKMNLRVHCVETNSAFPYFGLQMRGSPKNAYSRNGILLTEVK